MFYNISRTLSVLPYISYGLLAFVWILMEIKNVREQVGDSPTPEPGRGGFIVPPGDGYEYYISSNQICYILRKTANQFRIYIIQGDPPRTKMKRDKYGTYFNARCQDSGTAEHIVDTAFGM